MKISQESYKSIVTIFKANKHKIEPYAKELKENGKYKDFNTRLAFDCKAAFLSRDFIINVLYDKEDLNDDTLKTALVRALKDIKII